APSSFSVITVLVPALKVKLPPVPGTRLTTRTSLAQPTSGTAATARIRAKARIPRDLLQFAGTPRHRLVPQAGAVVVENQLGFLRGGEPVVPGHLVGELPRSPACIAEREQALFGAMMMADVLQDLRARGHRHAAVDGQRVRQAIIGGMDDKAELGL